MSLANDFVFRMGTLSLSGTITNIYDGVILSIECTTSALSQEEGLRKIQDICSNIEAALQEQYKTTTKTTTTNTQVKVPQLSNFDMNKLPQLQKRYNLPEHSPMRYETLQVLDMVKALRKDKGN